MLAIIGDLLSPCELSELGGRKFSLKKKYTHTCIWCQRICLSVCLSVTNFDLNYFRTGEIEWAKIFWGISLSKSHNPIFLSQHKKSVSGGQLFILMTIFQISAVRFSKQKAGPPLPLLLELPYLP